MPGTDRLFRFQNNTPRIAQNVQYYLWCHWTTILADGSGSRLTLESRLPEDGNKTDKIKMFQFPRKFAERWGVWLKAGRIQKGKAAPARKSQGAFSTRLP